MAGHRPWSELRNKMTAQQRAAADARFSEMKLGLILAEIRKHSGLTQTELAERLGIGQSTISQIESADDIHLTTLKKIVAELGGEIVLHMPAGDIPLTGPAP